MRCCRTEQSLRLRDLLFFYFIEYNNEVMSACCAGIQKRMQKQKKYQKNQQNIEFVIKVLISTYGSSM